MSAQNVTIPASALHFLNTLKENNNRDWFNANKDLYLEQLLHIEAFADALLGEMNAHDVIETVSGKKSLHRIYRDTRFSLDKTPYKTNWSGGFTRATALRRGGYYFNIQPGNSFIAGGFWAPEPRDMKLIRDDISFDPAPLKKIISDKTFTQTFGSLLGEQLKTTPKGFDPNNEAIDLLRYKQFLLQRNFTDKEVTGADFLKNANQTFILMRPFFDYMSEVLTSNPDGDSVV
ncbi:hypothetical protein DYBT9623_00034 [Dyadobacter sp. CECT 9623]|uniref:TIGR02453 family protein n=1 Tax=Dyadobacter linearis TaxID=2823330 RepID=A0ABN7R1X2_9BACT|nr:DUF2461 domain-containing protein [Dyadobacter sp. CECT 9623]CAG5067314.1 hypothetical protein DYBT9623_00034 [Dyadobacter sp. CECT 9623]